MPNYDFGSLSGGVQFYNNYYLSNSSNYQRNDYFEFDLNNSRTINLSLTDVSAGDDVDLYLYRDNGNGYYDSSDTLVDSSLNWGSSNETISYNASPGTYFARAYMWSGGSNGSATYDLSLSSTYDMGSVGYTPVSRNNYNVSASDETDVFEIRTATSGSLNINLHDISAGDDVDLRLYSDVNSNGIWDEADRAAGPVASSVRGGNHDDVINYRVTAGQTYFIEADYYAPGSTGTATYDLDVSVTSGASNLLGDEYSVGNINYDTTRSGWVGNTDTMDSYAFSLGFYEGVNISMYGLSADADIRLIQDNNGNGVYDSGELVQGSYNGANFSESISGIDLSGNYILQVYQYSGNTNYTVGFDHYTTTYA